MRASSPAVLRPGSGAQLDHQVGDGRPVLACAQHADQDPERDQPERPEPRLVRASVLRPKPSGTSTTVTIAYCSVPHSIGLSARRPGALAARHRRARITAVAVHTAIANGPGARSHVAHAMVGDRKRVRRASRAALRTRLDANAIAGQTAQRGNPTAIRAARVKRPFGNDSANCRTNVEIGTTMSAATGRRRRRARRDRIPGCSSRSAPSTRRPWNPGAPASDQPRDHPDRGDARPDHHVAPALHARQVDRELAVTIPASVAAEIASAAHHHRREATLIPPPAPARRPTDRPCGRSPPPAPRAAAHRTPGPGGSRSTRSEHRIKCTQPLSHREPVTAGQQHVEQHDSGPQPRGRRDRRRLVERLADDVEAFGLEQTAREAAEARVIIDDQDAASSALILPRRALRVNPGIARIQGFHRGTARRAERTVTASESRRS